MVNFLSWTTFNQSHSHHWIGLISCNSSVIWQSILGGGWTNSNANITGFQGISLVSVNQVERLLEVIYYRCWNEWAYKRNAQLSAENQRVDHAHSVIRYLGWRRLFWCFLDFTSMTLWRFPLSLSIWECQRDLEKAWLSLEFLLLYLF